MFPRMRPGMNKVAEQCLASLVFHVEFLRKESTKNHAIFDTFVFSQAGVVDKLLPFVTTAIDGSIHVTGVPPHVAQMSMQEKLGEDVEKSLAEVRSELAAMRQEYAMLRQEVGTQRPRGVTDSEPGNHVSMDFSMQEQTKLMGIAESIAKKRENWQSPQARVEMNNDECHG
eukprot:767297-Hanusia_phi.AAC.2